MKQDLLDLRAGQDASPPGPTPPKLLGDDPVADFERGRSETLRTFGQEGAEVTARPNASAQAKLLAYTGRKPD